MFIFLKKKKFLLLSILTFLSSLSLLETIRKAINNGCDFQWHPAKLFWEGINHYKYFINGGERFMCQGGEYAHALQIFLYPFAIMDWESAKISWIIVNIFFVFAIPLMICNKFLISKFKTWLILLIFITCYPARMSINYGQQSLLILFLLILPFVSTSYKSFFFSGLSYVKYSSGYVIFLYFLFQKKIKFFLFLLIIPIVSWIIYFSLTKSDPLTNLFDPLTLIMKMNYTKTGDLYSILNNFLFIQNNIVNKAIILVLIFFLNAYFLFKVTKIFNPLARMSLVLLLPLLFFPHSNYDYVLLLPFLILGLSDLDIQINKINFYFVIYYFYLNRIIKHIINHDQIFDVIIFLLLFYILVLNIRYYSLKKYDYLK